MAAESGLSILVLPHQISRKIDIDRPPGLFQCRLGRLMSHLTFEDCAWGQVDSRAAQGIADKMIRRNDERVVWSDRHRMMIGALTQRDLPMRVQENNRLEAGAPSEIVRQSLQDHLAYLDQAIAAVEKQIREHIDHHPDLKHQRDLLTSITGIGETTAHKLLSENIQSFTSTREAAAYAGLNPQLRESGTSVHGRPRLSKVGRAGLRKALYFPAISAMRHNPVIMRMCARLEQKGKPKMVQIGAAMRKLLCLASGVLKSGVPFDPAFSLPMQAIP